MLLRSPEMPLSTYTHSTPFLQLSFLRGFSSRDPQATRITWSSPEAISIGLSILLTGPPVGFVAPVLWGS